MVASKKKKAVVKPKAKKRKPGAKTVRRDSRGRLLKGSILPDRGPQKIKINLTGILRKILAETFSDGKTRGQKVMEALCGAAESGEPHAVGAIKEIMNRVDGKVPDRVHIGTDALSTFSDEQLESIIKGDN